MQPGLFEDEKIATKFEEYHEQNPEVYQMFKVFAYQLIDAGAKHVGAKAIMERIRFETAVTAIGKFKVNNNYTPFYARLFEREHPQHAGIFEKRRSQADKEMGLEK